MNNHFLILLIFLINPTNSQRIDPSDTIRTYGYKSESYPLKTSDGYSLMINRIVPKAPSTKLPVLMIHGLLVSANEFLQLRNESLPFILSNHGFDVYLGNHRGTKHSSHLKYSRESADYWNYSLHEFGYYDLAAMIDFVLKKTGHKQLHVVGLSQGTVSILVLLSERPEYNKKVAQAHLIGPTIFLGNLPNNIQNAVFRGFDRRTFLKPNRVDFSPIFNLFGSITPTLCDQNAPQFIICKLIQRVLYGDNVDHTFLRNFFDTHLPYVSEKQMAHYNQLVDSGKFQKYDFGYDMNMKVYGYPKPPEYDLRKVSAAMYVYLGSRDGFVSKKDAELLRHSLPNVKDFFYIPNFNHIDYEGARVAVDQIYMRMVNSMDSNSNNLRYRRH